MATFTGSGGGAGIQIDAVATGFIDFMITGFAVASVLIPTAIFGFIIYRMFMYKYPVLIIKPGNRELYTKAKISKNELVLAKPKKKIPHFNLDYCGIDKKGNYTFAFFESNPDLYIQLHKKTQDLDKQEMIYQEVNQAHINEMDAEYNDMKQLLSMEGFEKYKDFIFLGTIIVFQIVGMSLLFKAAGLA